jgi:hypothetical protein
MKNFPFVPNGSFGRSVVGADGFLTTLFFGFLFSDHEKGIKFYKSVDSQKERCFVLCAAAACPSGGVRASLTNIVGGVGKGSEANDATLHGASVTLRGSLKVNSLYLK